MRSGLPIVGPGPLAIERAIELVGSGVPGHSRSASATNERKRSRFRWLRARLCSTWNASLSQTSGERGGDDDTGQLRVSSLESGDVAGKELDDARRGEAGPASSVRSGSDEEDTCRLQPPEHLGRCNERKRPSAEEDQR